MTKQIALIVATCLTTACMPNYSNGERNGTITKLSKKGVIFKSWEGEMIQGGVRNKSTPHYDSKGNYTGSTNSSIPNVFAFNVDPKVIDKVQEAMESGEPVRLVYRQWLLAPWTISNDSVVIDVKK